MFSPVPFNEGLQPPRSGIQPRTAAEAFWRAAPALEEF